MAGLVDHERVLADFEAHLVADGRQSHGTRQLVAKLAELRAEHRVHEPAEAAVLRRFGDQLIDTFFGLLPDPGVTDDPLTATDPRTVAAMDGGARIRST